MLIDFKTVQRALRRTVEPLSDTDLRQLPLLAGLNPSSENLARKLFEGSRPESARRHRWRPSMCGRHPAASPDIAGRKT